MPLNLVTLMLGSVVLVRLVISIMPTDGWGGGWLVLEVRLASCLGVTLAEDGGWNTPIPAAGPMPGDSI